MGNKFVKDLTGATAVGQVRDKVTSSGVVLELSTTNSGIIIDGPNGIITLFATVSGTSNIPVGTYVYDVLVTQSGITSRTLAGNFYVSRTVTQ